MIILGPYINNNSPEVKLPSLVSILFAFLLPYCTSAQNASLNIYSSTVKIISGYSLSIGADVNILSGSSIDNAGAILLAGSWTNNGNGLINGSSGLVHFASASANTETITGNTGFYDITLDNSSGSLVFAATLTKVAHNITINGGTMISNSNTTIEFNGTGTSNLAGGNNKNFYDVQINAGVTATITNGDVAIAHNFTNNGTYTFSGTIKKTSFNGSNATQSLSGSGLTTFGNLTIGSSLIGAQPTILNAGAHNFTISGLGSGTSTTLNFNKNSIFNGNTNTVTISTTNCTISGSGTANFNNVHTSVGIDFGNGLSNISDTLKINNGGFVNNNGPTYATGSLLQYYINGNYDRNIEWSKTSGADYPYDVELSNNTYLNIGNHTIADLYYGIANNLTVDAGSTLDMNNTGKYINITKNILINGTVKLSTLPGGDIDLGGNWTDNGTFIPNSRIVGFEGTSTQNLAKSNSPFSETFDDLDINNTFGGVTLNSTPITITTQLRLMHGVVFAASNLVTVNSTSSDAIIDYDSIPSVTAYYTSSWINGTIKRNALVGGTYYFPIGTSSYYELLKIVPIGGSGLTDLTTSFSNPSCNTISTQIATDLPYINNTQVNTGLDYGYWTVSPNGSYSSPKYNITLYETGYNNCASFQPSIKDSAYGVLKRTNSSSPWTGTFFGSDGYHHNSLQQQFNPSGSLWCFKAIRDSVPSFSDYAIGYNGQDITLPLQLIAFNAHYENNLVHLNWTTASELNTDHFEIDRSEDGLQFENIAKEEAAHHSISTLNYSYDDENAVELNVSPLYYRLRMVDEDSSASYSMISSVQLPFSSSLQVQAIPNPFSDHLLLNVISSKVQAAQITVSDEQGVVQLATGEVSLQPGKNTFEFSSLEYLPSAVYFIRIATDASTVTRKIVKD